MNFIQYLPDLMRGLGMTLSLMVIALSASVILALILTPASMSKHIGLKWPVDIFVFFIRGTPLLVQIFLIYYGSAQFEWIRTSFLWIVLKEPFACAAIALALNSTAYTIVLLKGAIESVPKDEIIACHALGMSRSLTFRHFTLPRAFRIILPAYSNEVIIVLKATSLASTITILDLMGMTNKVAALTYATIPFLLVAGGMYLMMNIIIMSIFKKVEEKSNRYLVQGES